MICNNFLCQHPTSVAEVLKLINEMKFDELRQMMMSPLSFGTAGNRYILFDGLTFIIIHIELTISFLISQNRTVNFQNLMV